MPIANGLFHRWPEVRDNALDLLIALQRYPVGLSRLNTNRLTTAQIGQQAVAAMNYFHRKTYLHLLEQRQMLIAEQEEQLGSYAPSPTYDQTQMSPTSPETIVR